MDFDSVLRTRAQDSTANARQTKSLGALCASDLHAPSEDVDGHRFSQLILAAFIQLNKKKAFLNRTNVFPYADGDTGNNMVVCVKKPTRNLAANPSPDICLASSRFAADVLLSSQGNSGTLLSHFWISLSKALNQLGEPSVSVAQFAEAVAVAGAQMATAIKQPVEGTLLTVIRDASVATRACAASPFGSLPEFIAAWHSLAAEALGRTPDQLVVGDRFVLREAGVEDSGAAGFVAMLEGMMLACRADKEITARMQDPETFAAASLHGEAAVSSALATAPVVHHDVCDSIFRYCTEVVFEVEGEADTRHVEEAFSQVDGDSLVVIAAGSLVKVHMHTLVPSRVFEVAQSLSLYGKAAVKEKVEDMKGQKSAEHGAPEYENMSAAKVGLVTEGWSLPWTHCRDAGVGILPITITTDSGDPYLSTPPGADNEEIGIVEFFNSLRLNPQKLTAASPTVFNCQLVLERALAAHPDRHIIVLHINAKIGTLCASVVKAVSQLAPELQARVSLYDSGTIGQEEGVLARQVLQCASQGMSKDEVIRRLEHVHAAAFHITFMAGKAVKDMAAMGRFPDLGDGSDVDEAATYAFGQLPTDKPPTDVDGRMKAMTLPLGHTDGQKGVVQLEASLFEGIRAGLKPGQKIRDLMVWVAGPRPDLANELINRMRDFGLPLEESEVLVLDMCIWFGLVCQWGDLRLAYWVE